MSSRRSVGGFTLVELLVVISIIGMLMALLLPAVQSAREAGRRNTCANDQKNIATAMVSFDAARNYFPGYANQINAINVTANNGYTYVVGYIVPILPYLERNDLYRSYTDASQAASSTYQALLVCPSNPPTTIGGPQLAYVVNGGYDYQVTGTSPPATTGLTATAYTIATTNSVAEGAANGVCFNQTPHLSGAAYPTGVKVGSNYVSSNDGATYTLLVSENNQANFWTMTNGLTPAGNNLISWINTTATNAIATNYAPILKKLNTFVWFPLGGNNTGGGTTQTAFPTSTVFRINGNKALAQQAVATTSTYGVGYSRPSSNHTGGVNAFFCDGHYRFLAEDMNYLVLRQLMTSNYQQAIGYVAPTTGSTNYQFLPLDDSMY